MRPYAYIRKSTHGTDESMSDQIANVHQIVQRNGRPQDDPELVLLTDDWGISASRQKRAKRLDFNRLVEAIRAGEVSHLYAYSHDRLARDQEGAAILMNALADANVLCTTGERTFNLRDTMDRQMWGFTAMQSEFVVEQAQKKAKDRVARQRERGMILGNKPFGSRPGEDPQEVVEAFRIAGTYQGAVRLLIERGIASQRSHLPSKRGGGMQGWSASTVRAVIQRHAPELVPPSPKQGVRTRATHIFQRLIVCPHDGAILTTAPRPDASVAYVCRIGQRSPAGTHPRPYVIAERGLLDWAKKATRGQFAWDVALDAGSVENIARLENRKRLAAKALMASAMTEEEFERIVEDVDEELRGLKLAERAASTWHLGIDWALPPADLNVRLRELWHSVEMAYVPTTGPRNHQHTREFDLVPVRPLWRIEPAEVDPAAEDEMTRSTELVVVNG